MTGTDTPLRSLLSAFFRALDRHTVPFCVLRNYDSLPEFSANDVDVLVRRQHLGKAARLLAAAAGDTGLVLHRLTEYQCISMMFFDPGDPVRTCHVDLFHGILWHGISLVRPEPVLASRRPLKNFFIPAPAWEQAVTLLSGLVFAGRIRETYRPGILSAARSAVFGREFLAALVSSLGRRTGTGLWQAVVRGRWNDVAKQSRSVKIAVILNHLRQPPARQAAALMREAGRLVRRLRDPAGLSVAVVGPDGAGKSSVVRTLGRSLGHTFKNGQLTVHFRPAFEMPKRPGLLQCQSGGRANHRPNHHTPGLLPHARPARPMPVSVLFLLYHTLMFVLGYAAVLAPARLKGKLVCLERYYYDVFVDPLRLRMRLPAGLARKGFFFVPKPDLVILLDAPAATLLARKQEVSPQEVRRQCGAYRRLVRGLANGHIVNAAQPLDQVATNIRDRVMAFLAQRTEKQWRRTFGRAN